MARYEVEVREVRESSGGSGCGTMLFWFILILGVFAVFGGLR